VLNLLFLSENRIEAECSLERVVYLNLTKNFTGSFTTQNNEVTRQKLADLTALLLKIHLFLDVTKRLFDGI
jgi:hypothetical protein